MHPLTVLLMAFLQSGSTPQGPEQPLPYSHKTHLAQGLKCKDCHENQDPGEAMGIPATAKCMACHVAIKKESPHIQKLAELHANRRPVPWVRVYRIPGYVYFSHRVHIEIGTECKTCHGEVASRERLWKEGNVSMGACMDCHRMKKASNDCSYCHDGR